MAKENLESAIGDDSSHTRTNTHTHTHTHTAAISSGLENLECCDENHSHSDDGNGNGDQNCNTDDIHTTPDTPQKAAADTCKDEQEEASATKKRSVSFQDRSFEEIIEIPNLKEYNSPDDTTCIKDDLFYNDADYTRFRANEQRRYDKMVTKKLQQMVQEKMQPKINEAVANGATLEDIEAMVPKTQAEMVEYLGGQEKINAAIKGSSFGGQLSQKAVDSNHRRSVGKNNENPENTVDSEIDSPRNKSRKQTIRLANDSNHIRNVDKTHGEIETTGDTTNESQRTVNRKRTIRSSRSSIEIPRAKNIIGTGNLDTNARTGGEKTMSVLEKAVAAREASVERKRARGEYNMLEPNVNKNNAYLSNNDETTMSVLEAVEAAKEASLELVAQDEGDVEEFH